jgi:FkbM family methyltransferase
MDKLIIVDIGAASYPNHSFGTPKGHKNFEIHLFEPHPKTYSRLEDKFRGKKGYFLYNLALSNIEGTTTFYCTQKVNCSSIRKPNPIVLKKRKDITTYTEMEVKVNTLDNVLGHLTHIDYLKLDTQGSEYEILLGAKEMLPKVKKIQCEVEFIEWYKGQKLAEEVVEFLESKGFKKVGKKRASHTHCDLFFTRRDLL